MRKSWQIDFGFGYDGGGNENDEAGAKKQANRSHAFDCHQDRIVQFNFARRASKQFQNFTNKIIQSFYNRNIQLNISAIQIFMKS